MDQEDLARSLADSKDLQIDVFKSLESLNEEIRSTLPWTTPQPDRCNALRCNAVSLFNGMWHNAARCNGVSCNAVLCRAVQHTLQCRAM